MQKLVDAILIICVTSLRNGYKEVFVLYMSPNL